jgi:KaiC/GvpD/RAD55 family RecA-like ATPase
LIKNENSVIIVTTNQPYSILAASYERNKLDISKIQFIDAITRYAIGKVPNDARNCRFINHPANLTDLGIAITEVLDAFSQEKPCILFDSVSTLLIYIPSNNISKFIHFLTSKLRFLDSPGIFLAVEKGLDPLLMTQLTTYVDTLIDMEGETQSPKPEQE